VDVFYPEVEAISQGIGHTLTVADMRIGLEAEQGTALFSGNLGGAQ
jgi:hypothetical protein